MRKDTPDWHLQEWLGHVGKRQSSLSNELGWNKQKANYVWHGRTAYRRDLVNEIAAWLAIEPYELLMRPRDALALRRLRETATQIANEQSPPEPRTGTSG
jgi:hypothetical protein